MRYACRNLHRQLLRRRHSTRPEKNLFLTEPEVDANSSLDEVQVEVVLPVELLLREEYHGATNLREKHVAPTAGS